MTIALVLALFTCWFVGSLAICPSNDEFAAQCHGEAGRMGLRAAAWVGGLVALITAARLSGRRADR
ncbi:MAG TPA: hypothetical protein VF548_17825 [Allosphingosinicella sp.]|jgi:hypothetical protein